MLIGDKVAQADVFDHWARIDYGDKLQGLSGVELKKEGSRLLSEHHGGTIQLLPENLIWYGATVQESDLDNIYIMSEKGWLETSNGNTSIAEVASLVDAKMKSEDGHCCQIKDLLTYLESGQALEETFIMIAPVKTGPFTIVDGNHRLTAFYLAKRLTGLNGYVGLSLNVNQCPWTSCTQFKIPLK